MELSPFGIDSQLVVSQLNEDYKTKDEAMATYVWKVRGTTGHFSHLEITNILRSKALKMTPYPNCLTHRSWKAKTHSTGDIIQKEHQSL